MECLSGMHSYDVGLCATEVLSMAKGPNPRPDECDWKDYLQLGQK